jgi:hypothetical protein
MKERAFITSKHPNRVGQRVPTGINSKETINNDGKRKGDEDRLAPPQFRKL